MRKKLDKFSGIKLWEPLKIKHGFDELSLMPKNLYRPRDNNHSVNSHVLPSLIRKFSEAAKNSTSDVTCWGQAVH